MVLKAVTVTGWNQELQELSVGSEIKMLYNLPVHYHRQLKARGAYQLLWPGSEIDMWEWGSLSENVSKQVSTRSHNSHQIRLNVPASEPITLTATEEIEPWPERPATHTDHESQAANRAELQWRREMSPPPSPPLLSPNDRDWGRRSDFELGDQLPQRMDQGDSCRSRDQGDVCADTVTKSARPITFHTTAFTSSISTHSGREDKHLDQHLDSESWKNVEDESSGFAVFDDPPIPVNLGDDGEYGEEFATLHPGKSWSYLTRAHNDG